MKRILLAVTLMLSTATFAASTRTLDGQQITNGAAVLTLPTSTDTLTGKATTDVLTNKSISGSTNTFSAIPSSAVTGLSGSNSGDVTLGTANGLSLVGQALSLQAATASVPGALLAADFTTFAAKLSSALANGSIFVGSAGGVATAVPVSGDLTAVASGAFTIGAKKVQASKIDSGAALTGTVLTADGSGGVSYIAPVSTAPNISGSIGTPTAITAAGGITFSGSNYANTSFINGSGGAVTVTATPQIVAGTLVGQRLELVGGTNTVTLADANGLSLNGSWVGGVNSVLGLVWDGSVWHESSRR